MTPNSSWWFQNPIETSASKWVRIFPDFRGWKNIWKNHHPGPWVLQESTGGSGPWFLSPFFWPRMSRQGGLVAFTPSNRKWSQNRWNVMDGESNPSSINCHCFIWRDFSCPNDEREASSILTVTVACLREDIIIWTLIQWWVTNDNYQIHLDLGLYHKEKHIRERERERNQ